MPVDFGELESTLRNYSTNPDEGPYDPVGVMHLALALLDNIGANYMESDWEVWEDPDVGLVDNDAQRRAILAMGALLQEGRVPAKLRPHPSRSRPSPSVPS